MPYVRMNDLADVGAQVPLVVGVHIQGKLGKAVAAYLRTQNIDPTLWHTVHICTRLDGECVLIDCLEIRDESGRLVQRL